MKPFFSIVLAVFLSVAGLGQPQPHPAKGEIAPTGDRNAESVRMIESLDGRALYHAYCAACHGSDGRGGGTMAASFKVPPPDLTKIAARNHGIYPAVRVEGIISGEVEVPGGHGTRTMPVWGPIFSQIAWDQDLGRLRVHNLAAYLDRLQTK